MQSHELLREVFQKTSAKRVAADLSLSLSMIYKWAEPPDDASGSGATNPLDRIHALLRSTGDERILQWISQKGGGFFIKNPSKHNAHPDFLIPATNEIIQEFADLLAVIASAAADNQIYPRGGSEDSRAVGGTQDRDGVLRALLRGRQLPSAQGSSPCAHAHPARLTVAPPRLGSPRAAPAGNYSEYPGVLGHLTLGEGSLAARFELNLPPSALSFGPGIAGWVTGRIIPSRRCSMKVFLTLLLVLGLGAGGYFYWKRLPAAAPEQAAPPRPTTATVELRNIQFAVSAAGDIGPADQVSVRSEINGRIVELPVDIGDQVKRGDLLCRLDDKDLQTEKAARLAQIDGAKLQLQKAGRNLARSQKLITEKLISQEAFDDSRTDYDLATNALDRAGKELSQVEDKLFKTRIVAPFDCTVLIRPVSLGQILSGAAGFNSGTEIMSIANLNEMIVNAHVNQADVIRLQQGREVEVQAESVAGVRMRGIVERIAPQAVSKNGIKGFSARVAIKDIDPRVRPGMTAILNIPVSSADNVLAVPLAAVFTESGERYVFVKNEDKFERRPISIGVTDYTYAEVLKGLLAGDVISLDQSAHSRGLLPPALTGAGPGTNGHRRPEASGITGSPGGGTGGRPAGAAGGAGGSGGAGRSTRPAGS